METTNETPNEPLSGGGRVDPPVRPYGTAVRSYNRDGSITPGTIYGHKIVNGTPCYMIEDSALHGGRTRWAFETSPFGFDVAA